MISTLEIHNFKSIRHLTLDCRRVNVFIGEPNTGKSNVLEAIGLFSALFTGNLQDFVRMEELADLFYNVNLKENVHVHAGPYTFFCQFDGYTGTIWARLEVFSEIIRNAEEPLLSVRFTRPQIEIKEPYPARIRFYRFSPQVNFQRIPSPFLLPPDGKNLPFLLLSNAKLRESLKDLFAPFGLRLVVERRGDDLKVQTGAGDDIAQFPWCVVSETLLRMAFYLAAIETNRDAVLIFEEPESHAFPYYTKHLAERIALEDSNQYFISTHNPYLLVPLIEKTPAEELALFITYFRENQTMVKPIAGKEELGKVLDLNLADIFLNLDLLVGEETW